MKNIKVITVDFWNTLFDSHDGNIRNDARLKVLLSTLKDLEFEIDFNKFDEVVRRSWQYYSMIWETEFRTPNAEELINFVWNEMNFDKNPKAIDYIVKFFEKSIIYFPPNLLPNAKDVICKLSQKYKLAIVSDTGFSPGIVMRELMDTVEILKYFSAFSFSDETGVAKPHPKAFDTILKELDCMPEEALHIGDIERTDICGARDIGMRAIKYCGDRSLFLKQYASETTRAEFMTDSWLEIENYLLK